MIALGVRAALPQPDLLVQAHFAGVQKIAADPRANAFTNEFCSREALALRAQTAARLGGWLSGWLQTNLSVKVTDGPATLRPLLDDLQASEFFLEIRAAANGQPEAGLAIKLAPARARLWQASLKPFFALATFQSTGDWLIFDSNPALLGIGDRLARNLSAPPADWFDLDVNWPRLAQWHPLLKQLALPETQFTVTAPDNDFRVNGKLFFPENLALNLEPWRIPTNSVHVPFTSFTAVRGFSSWLQSQPWAQSCLLAPVPNQAVIWSQPLLQTRTFAAVPVPNAASALSQACQRLAPVFSAANAANELIAPITPELAGNEVDFTRTPWVGMKLRALTEPAGQFLVGELVPNTANRQPLPPELYRRLETKGLVFYHYEATGDRIKQLLYLTQLGLMITRHDQLSTGAAAFNWVQGLGTNLTLNPAWDHTDTEIIVAGPAELAFARKSPVIFTALEFYALEAWLDGPAFPSFDLVKLAAAKKHLPQPAQPPFQLTPLYPKPPSH